MKKFNKKEYNKNYWNKWYQNNKERVKNRMKVYNRNGYRKTPAFKDSVKRTQQNIKSKNMKWLLSYLGVDKISCSICGYNKCFDAIHYHHLEPSQKNGNVNDTFSHWIGSSLKRFQKKITDNRGIFVCSNCHIEIHKEERNKVKE